MLCECVARKCLLASSGSCATWLWRVCSLIVACSADAAITLLYLIHACKLHILTIHVCAQVFEQMQAASVRPETVLYAAIIDLLWMSGIVGAQQRAQQLFQLACRQSVRGMQAAQEEEEGGGQLQVTHLVNL